jgi:hypothetical protein
LKVVVYPITGNAQLVNAELISTFLNALFLYAEPGEGCLMIRGVGEKGTDQYGKLRDTQTMPMDGGAAAVIADAGKRWAQWHGGAFIVPAVMDARSLVDKDGSEDRVLSFPALCMDLDKGNTDGLVVDISNAVGNPTLIVESGGITEAGTPKLHIYWRLTELCEQIDRMCRLREILALKTGGDTSFKRAPQIIRIPGTLHCKNGGNKLVTIRHVNPKTEYDLGDLEDRILEMRFLVEVTPEQKAAAVQPMVRKTETGWDFSDVARGPRALADTLSTPVHEGATDIQTRWDAFNQVWGHYLHCVRIGEMDLNKAEFLCRGWITANMIPAWDEQKIRDELMGLYKADIKNYGPMPTPAPQIVAAQAQAPGSIGNLGSWAMHRWVSEKRPSRRFLVEGLVQAGAPHIYAAESGSGKSMAMLDLAIKMAAKAAQPDLPLSWMGEMISADVAGRPVVFFTAEDDKLELEIRAHDIDPDGLRFKAGNYLIVVPLPSAGGVFPLVQRGAQNTPGPSQQWQIVCQQMWSWPKPPSLVTIDTFNATLHGEDVRGDIVQEYINEVQRSLSGRDIASMMTHHFRKSNGQPIRNLEDMTDAIRGSGALKAGVRVVLGMFQASDYRRRLKQMNLPVIKNSCFRFGVVKANNPEMFNGMKTLVRLKSGLLADMTDRDKLADGPGMEHESWLAYAVGVASIARFPFTKTGVNGLYTRRSELPQILQTLGDKELRGLAQRCTDRGSIVAGRLADSKGGQSGWLDVPGGPVAMKQGYRDPGIFEHDWDLMDYDQHTGKILPV